MPNLFILYILFIGLFIGKKLGAIFGLFFGIYLDILIGQAIGVTGVMLAIIGLLAEYFDKKIQVLSDTLFDTQRSNGCF